MQTTELLLGQPFILTALFPGKPLDGRLPALFFTIDSLRLSAAEDEEYRPRPNMCKRIAIGQI